MGIEGIDKLQNNKEDNIVGNVFDNDVPPEDALALGDKLFSILPSLADSHHYDLKKLSDGRTVVTVEEKEMGEVSEVYAPRRFAGPTEPTELFAEQIDKPRTKYVADEEQGEFHSRHHS